MLRSPTIGTEVPTEPIENRKKPQAPLEHLRNNKKFPKTVQYTQTYETNLVRSFRREDAQKSPTTTKDNFLTTSCTYKNFREILQKDERPKQKLKMPVPNNNNI